MVMKGRKSKSKRVTLKQKHKIIRNLKVHHKKKAKEAKKQIVTSKRMAEKDEKYPGIPNDWPLKEQELKALEDRRARAIADIEQNKERAQKRKLGSLEDDGIRNLSRDEPKEFGKSRDNSGRAFYKELVKVIEESDVILEVLDARDPLGTRCIDMEKMVMKSGPEKHIVLLLNKIDLVPREAVEKWLKYLREELPAVAFKCSTQEQRSNYGWKPAPKSAKTNTLLQTSDCLGAETLIKLLKNYSRSHEIKKSITVGVIGLPNVGKSSLINSLRRSHVVNVGSTPGLTRSMQQVQLDKNVKLLDCPGVVMLKSGENDARMTLRNCKRIEKLDDPIGPVKEILNLCPKETLAPLYKLQSFDLVDDFLQKVANVRGKLKKGGRLDVEAAARIVLHDWNEGKIPYYTMPPSRNQGENLEATIVSELGKEFNVEEVYKGESSFIGSLKSVEDFHNVEVPSHQPLDFDKKMLEDEVQPDVLIESNKQPEEMSDDRNVDHPMEDHGKEGDRSNAKSTKRKQNEKLYTAEGILNPRLRKAEKKKRKKALRSSSGDDVMDADYDFKVDFTNRGINMDVGDDDDDKDGVDHQNNGEEAMTVV